MVIDDRNWFVRERSKALAAFFLTSRSDVSVEREFKRDDGVDLMVALKSAGGLSTKQFVVQVKGALSSDERKWVEDAKPLFKSGGMYLPTCVFVINVRSNSLAYAWLAEPKTENNSAKLFFVKEPKFHVFGKEEFGQIIDRVRAWYDALAVGFTPRAT